jgi:hypothetical protein
MSAQASLSRADFELLVAEHRQLILLANELEYQLYRLGAAPTLETAAGCQHAAGELIGVLRQALFRHDQQVLPVLEEMVNKGE